MKQKRVLMYGIAAAGVIAAIILVRRHIARKKIEALKRQEMDPTEKVADVQKNFDNNPNNENW